MPAQVRIRRKRIGAYRIVENHALPGARDIMDDRIRNCRIGHRRFQQTYDDGVATGSGFSLYPVLNTSGKNQQAALSTRVLDRGAHERIDQFLQHDLARHGLRDFDNRSQIQLFDRRADHARWTRDRLVFPKLWVQLFELSHLADSSPTKITVPCLPEVQMGKLLEPTCRIEARRELVRKRLILDEAVFLS